MKYLDRVLKLADKFENKLKKYAQVHQQEQKGTTELFFGSSQQQQQFANIIQDTNGPIAKFLLNYSAKSGQPASFSLKVNAEPGKGAAWILTVSPANLKSTVQSMIDQEFKKLTSQSMHDRLNAATTAAKSGGGSGGPLNVGSLDIG